MVDVEIDTVTLLTRIESTGFAFDRVLAEQLVDKVRRRLDQLELDAKASVGGCIDFNIDSPKQVANVSQLYNMFLYTN
jgi:DNA polymerase I-like protein with 3'-5' exonuclease and polymerase domains